MSEKNESALSYYIPNRSRKKTILRIPESHSLYVCPSACGRRIALRAYENGEKNFLSFLYIAEEDAVSGQYESNIYEAIAELVTVLDPPPKAFTLYFSCVDNFLNTDEKALLEELEARFPGLRFIACHHDPIASDEKISPGMRLHHQMYEFLEYTGKKDSGINLIGSYAPFDPDGEFFRVMSECGVGKIRQLFECGTYAAYQEMADSRLNLVLTPMGELAAENMAERLGIPYYVNPATYEIDEIAGNYRNIAALLGRKCLDLQAEISETRRIIRMTRERVGPTPVIIDSSATMRPFALAKALLGYGFNVAAVFAGKSKIDDTAERQWLQDNFPQLMLIHTGDTRAFTGYGLDKECLAVGYDCAYLLQARCFVDIFNDEALYGFHGVRKLMQLMGKACEEKR
ncbi:Nitrogenase component 1 type Oxidoreductase [Sporobacter termitidis DSM 10068]|uniref:Nitrogenase component 1 type Oxidoreductase n=1 Tax=Sporobacter termitidis DSM 10068 TaxID=1123282 RepID=A0A1M5XCI6_9FIRM|nr:nitrogenase component 1 [Sporobacter termitidis]SHH97555.1 Nitrogenase component 1 type Oxidoreductase [Sporobacter termitidis DSM 10068]